jgi:hypothetical protein
MMTLTQYLLGKLAEEGSEVAQIALKTQQFGLSEMCPGQPFDNAERSHQELDDVAAIVEMLNDQGFGYQPDRDRIETKKAEVAHYLRYSVDLGAVEPAALKECKPLPHTSVHE